MTRTSADTTLCLGFLGTVSGSLVKRDLLLSYKDFVSWAAQAGVLSEAEAGALSARAQHNPQAAESALHAIRSIRGLLNRLTSLAAEGGAPSESDIAALDNEVPHYMAYSSVSWQDGGFSIQFAERGLTLDWPVSRILWSALQLLMGGQGDLGRLKRCANAACGRIFMDMSRNRSRRWCDMSSCGNREKARRFHSRRKASAGSPRTARPEARPAPIRRRYAGGGDVEVGTDD